MSFKKFMSLAISLIIILSNVTFLSFATEEKTVSEGSSCSSLEEFLTNNYKYENSEISSDSEDENEEIIISTNRLIVTTESGESIDDYYGAVDSIEPYDDCHILQYASSEDAAVAYKLYENENCVSCVEYDVVFTIEDVYGNESPESESMDSYDISWGAYTAESHEAKEKLNSTQIIQDDVVVAVIDTGVKADHPFLEDESGDSRVLKSDREMDNSPTEDNHGTHVAGIIADNTNSNVKIRSYNYFWYRNKENTASTVTLTDEIYSAIADEVDVINMSLSGEGYSYAVERAIRVANDNGIVVVVAAGNKAADASGYYPANIPESITVASTNYDDKPRDNSNFGSCVDIAAPGGDILSSVFYDLYAFKSGTSMASPFVAACAAMLKSINKQYLPSEIETIIEDSVYVPDGWNFNYGVGIVNFSNCISKVSSSAPRMTFDEKYNVIITAPSCNAVIYYTTDGSDPIIGVSNVYEGPIDKTGAPSVKAIAYEQGKLPSPISTLRMKWTEKIKVRYKGTKDLPLSPYIPATSSYSTDESIVTCSEKSIKGISVGEARVTVNLASGQKVTYKVTVEYESWQLFIIYFLFGFLWY